MYRPTFLTVIANFVIAIRSVNWPRFQIAARYDFIGICFLQLINFKLKKVQVVVIFMVPNPLAGNA